MTLSELIERLQTLRESADARDLGDPEVFFRHVDSGDCRPVGTAHVTNYVENTGPFDLPDGEHYVSLYG